MAQMPMSCGRARRESYGLPKRCERFLGPPLHHCSVAQGGVAPWIAVVEGDAHERLSRRKMRAPFEGLLQARDGVVVVLFRQPPEFALGACDELPGVEVRFREKGCAAALSGQEMRFNGSRHAARDHILDGEDLARIPVITLGPLMDAGGGINELRIDAHPLAR